jgi:hypothetical protein
MDLAARFLPPAIEPPRSVRDVGESPWYVEGLPRGGLTDLVHREAELIGDGRVAVIAPSARIAETAEELGVTPGSDLDAPIAVLTPMQAKGLEFDSVVVVDPGGIAAASSRGRSDLYVALTRTTNRLGLVVTGDLPIELRSEFAGAVSGRPASAAAE